MMKIEMNISDNIVWQTKKLGEICDILDNKRKPITKRNRTTGEWPYYGATGILDYVGDYIFDEKLVLIGEDGAKWESGEHTAFIADGKYWVNNHAHVIRPHRDIVLDNWIVYFFYLTDLTKHTTGLTVPKLNQANLRNIEIPLPPLPEQHRIVKILDEVFADVAKVKENAEKNLQNAKELFESYLQSVFTNQGKDWEEKRLGDVVATTQGVQIKKSLQIKAPKIGYKRYLYISDFDHEKNLKYVEDIYPKKLVTKDDLIVVNTGASAGKIFRGIDGILSNNLFKVSFSKDILNPNFLYYFVTSNIFRDFQKKIVRGTANPHMGHENFNLTPFSLPKLSEQKSIVTKLNALSAETKKLEAIYKKKLADLEELKKSVLKKAFNGEL